MSDEKPSPARLAANRRMSEEAMRRAVERFWSLVDKSDPSGCWLWTGVITEAGYGYFRTKANGWRGAAAHRFAWFSSGGGSVPEGMQLDHLCRVRNCVNPAHLEVVTPQENTLRGESPSSLNARKDRCPRCGGPYSIAKRGHRKPGRRCQPCHSERRRQRKAERRAAAIREDCEACPFGACRGCEAEVARRANGEAK